MKKEKYTRIKYQASTDPGSLQTNQNRSAQTDSPKPSDEPHSRSGNQIDHDDGFENYRLVSLMDMESRKTCKNADNLGACGTPRTPLRDHRSDTKCRKRKSSTPRELKRYDEAQGMRDTPSRTMEWTHS